MPLRKTTLLAFAVAVAAVILDQLSKWWVLTGLGMSLGQTIEISRIFDLTFTLNTGVSFGMFSGGEARWLLTGFSLVVAGAMSWWALQAQRRLFAVAVGLIIGGALGNVIDRILIGAVVDFLDFSGLGFPWIFNIADTAISVGVGLLILDSFLSERAAQPVGSESQTE
ncbi:MAG: signal peptidase II [Caulobacterales bacterium]|nr:signal peptidase II [Caulobacterales bacterium]